MSNTKKIKTEPLDPESERYRVCPECDVPFMANNFLRDYCSDHCKNRLNNRIKKNARIAEQVQLEAQKSTEFMEEKKRKLNFAISQMEKLGIDERGVIIHIDEILSLGIDLMAYENRYPVEGAPEHYYVTYGHYHVCWWLQDSLIIINQKPKK